MKIYNVVKTDNDLRKISNKEAYSLLGFTRLNGLIGKVVLPDTPISEDGVEAKRKLYNKNKKTLDQIRNDHSLYLSRCSLEEDLDEVIHDQMVKYLPSADGNVIRYLQEAKNNHMVELAEKLTKDDCELIFEHYNFACLKRIIE